MTYSFVCPECRSYFITRRYDQKFCSHHCASKNRKIRRERVFLTDPCFFNSRVPREEIRRLIEEKLNEEKHFVIARIDEIEVWEPEHAKTILEANGKWVFISPYWYKHSLKSGMVNRTTEGMGVDEWKTHGFTEKPKDAFQRKLLEKSEVPTT